MIRKILIANRGEIACRIIRTCRDMGIVSVAVFSDADANALHVEMANEAVHIGASPAAQSYLNGEAIIAAAKRTGADAIHPGYGFLSENAKFAQSVIDAGLIWIGPPPGVIELMGDKRRAKLALKDVPFVPGYMGEDQSDEAFIHAANEIGYPVMVKAAAGGGGKGMRLIQNPNDLLEGVESARREASQSFGDSTLILEKAIQNPRHVEVQIFGDTHGNVIALGERECSIQRRHQKVIEETPSTALDDSLRKRMCDAAVSIGQQIGYMNAGTVEFILDQEQNFYFLEMNTRLQVEHPVTEFVTGQDLVRLQIGVAQGGFLPPQFSAYGHAIEARVYAEDPTNDFLPTTGKLLHFDEPSTEQSKRGWSKLIVDSGVRAGSEITVHYDPMLAKVIAHGDTRDDAERRLDYALSQLRLLGVRSNIAFLRRILNHPEFIGGYIDTGFIERHPELLQEDADVPEIALIAAAVGKTGGLSHNWRNNPYRPIKHSFTYGDKSYEVLITPQTGNLAADSLPARYVIQIGEHKRQVSAISLTQGERGVLDFTLEIDGHRQPVTVAYGDNDQWWVHSPAGTHVLTWVSPLPVGNKTAESEGTLRSPMPGQVIKIDVEIGQEVKKGDILLVIEAMKMEHRIKAPYDGTITALHYQIGQTVEAGVKLLELQASE
ncbi:MAG TPA: biotin carboxylase N-terminal domain-containing protein [Oceanobacillus sp.]|nr:biotin carboxylase N-terminal domain-containing protein [Oceanobacillus sp.]